MLKSWKDILITSASLLMLTSISSGIYNINAKSNSPVTTQITRLKTRRANLQKKMYSYNRIIKDLNTQINELEHKRKQNYKYTWHKGTPSFLQGSWRSRNYYPKHLSKDTPKSYFYNYMRVMGKNIYGHYLNDPGDFNHTGNINYYRINRNTYKLVGDYFDTNGASVEGSNTIYVHVLPHNHMNINNYVHFYKKYKRLFSKKDRKAGNMKIYLHRTSHNDIASDGESLLKG